MSNKAITWAYQQTDIPGVARAVLVNLCDRADDEKDLHCFPQVATIVSNTGFGDRAVRYALNLLVSEGCIRRERQVNSDGSMGQYEYWILIDRRPKTASDASENPQANHGPAPDAGGGNLFENHRPARRAAGSSSRRKSQGNHGPAFNAAGPPPAPDAAGTTGTTCRSIEEPSLKNNPKEEHTSVVVEPDARRLAFHEIWKLWPKPGRLRSKNLAQCYIAFVKALGNRQPAMMVEAVRRYVRSVDNPKFVPAIDRWMRDGKFEHFLPEETSNVLQLPLEQKTDWRKIIDAWCDFDIWPRHLGDKPHEHGFSGPVEALEYALKRVPPDHPYHHLIQKNLEARKQRA